VYRKKVHTTEMAPVVAASLPEISQTSAIFKLPDETFLEILSCFPAVNFRYKISGLRTVWGQTFLPAEYAERLDVLRAITQTCRTLRRKFLSWLWEKVEACVAPERAAWYISLGNALESKCHILLKNPPLAMHVRVMSVTITRYRMDIILPAFASCLRSLPNLHTLELCHVHQEMTTKLKKAFEGVMISSIRTVVLPTIAHHILRSCPNVEDVTCAVGDGSQIVGTIASKCPRVERISGTYPSPAMLKRLAKKNPNMREVSFSVYGVAYPDISLLGIFKKLAAIEFQINLALGENPQDQRISAAKKILRASEYSGMKVVKFRVLRFDPNESIFGACQFVGVENLDIVVT